MRRFNFFHAFYLSFFSKALYEDVGRQWKGLGFAHLALLLALVWIPTAFQIHLAVGKFASEAASRALQDFPRVTIQDGVVETDPHGPHTFNDPDTGKPFLIIDTSADMPELDEIEGDVFVLTRSKLITVQRRRSQTRIHDLSGVQHFEVTKEDLERWLGILASGAAVVLYPLLLGGSLAYRMVQALIYAAIGLLLAHGARPAIGYDALVRLSAVAVTPVILLDTAKDLAGITIPFWWLLCFLIAMGYLHFGIKAVKDAAPAPQATAPLTGPPGIA